MSTNRLLSSAAVATVIFTMTSSIAIAQTSQAPAAAQVYDAKVIAEMGGPDRINFSGKLRMLSQRIPAAACNLNAKVSSELSKEILVAASAEFSRIVDALEHGDPGLGIIGKETRRKTLAALDKAKAQWEPIGAVVNLIQKEGITTSLTQQLADQNGPLLEAAKKLVSEISGQYADPAALTQADALRIDIAGRQRMLSQKMSKDFCLASSGINVEASLDSLKATTSTFEVSLTALREGMPAAGIKASTNPLIVEALDFVAHDWELIKADFATLKSGGTNSIEIREMVFAHLNTLLVDMNKAVALFAEISKQQI